MQDCREKKVNGTLPPPGIELKDKIYTKFTFIMSMDAYVLAHHRVLLS